jgi:hypothetical protein
MPQVVESLVELSRIEPLASSLRIPAQLRRVLVECLNNVLLLLGDNTRFIAAGLSREAELEFLMICFIVPIPVTGNASVCR